jgi:hypothetical protein
MNKPQKKKKLPIARRANFGSFRGTKNSQIFHGLGVCVRRDLTVRLANMSRPSNMNAKERIVHANPICGVSLLIMILHGLLDLIKVKNGC